MIAARVAALIADSLVLVMTGIKTMQTNKTTGSDSEDSGSGLERTLKGILLRDSEYYALIFRSLFKEWQFSGEDFHVGRSIFMEGAIGR